jgi:hypothetical protein
MRIERLAAVGAAVVVALGIGLAFAALGPPSHQRDEAVDAQTARRLEFRAMQDRQSEVLCGDFRLASPGVDSLGDLAHPSGHVCFDVTAEGRLVGIAHRSHGRR